MHVIGLQLHTGWFATGNMAFPIMKSTISPIKVPAEYAVREELPKTLNGDIIRRILREEELAKRK